MTIAHADPHDSQRYLRDTEWRKPREQRQLERAGKLSFRGQNQRRAPAPLANSLQIGAP